MTDCSKSSNEVAVVATARTDEFLMDRASIALLRVSHWLQEKTNFSVQGLTIGMTKMNKYLGV